ncbi:MAG: trypsin-like peptidase domain-containing protein [Alphaproteobacteria bacterium]|nr:trypsin-like peptidase domain-containing protein [Alphaproteobacteria bacterium]
MRHHLLRRITCAVVLLLAAVAPISGLAEEPLSGFAEQVASLMPAVVAIQTVATTPQGSMDFVGSGFIIDPSGIIVTNRHVLAAAYEITVTNPEIGPLKAKPIYISGLLDVALLKVEAGRPLPTLKLGDSDSVHVGDEVLLLGNPLGLGLSVSRGVISGFNRDIGESMYDHFFQTDGALNHGNSGGPMVNLRGEVIAVDTALISSPGNTGSIGLGFSMPINDVKFIIDQYLHNGRVIAGYLGARGQPINADLAKAFGLDRARGLAITSVEANGPAAGQVHVGDIVLEVNGQDASDVRAARRLIASMSPGQSLNMRLLRHGVEQEVTVTVGDAAMNPNAAMSVLGHAPASATAFATPSDPGMTVGEITDEVRRRQMLGNEMKGVLVKAVEPNSAAAYRKVMVGDVIMAVGDQAVATAADLKRELQAVVAKRVQFAALLVSGERGAHWIALPVEADR